MGYTGLEHVQYTVHNFRVAQLEITKPFVFFHSKHQQNFHHKTPLRPFFYAGAKAQCINVLLRTVVLEKKV